MRANGPVQYCFAPTIHPPAGSYTFSGGVATDDQALVEERVTAGMVEELSLEDRINDEVRIILEAYQQEMLKSGAQYAEMFKKVKGELVRKYKAVI